MLDKIKKRIISGITAAIMAISNVSPIMPIYAEEVQTTVCEETTGEENKSTEEFDLTHMSIELYPDEQNEEKTVMLDGLMPEGAEAQAVDVSEEHDGIAAYDITITAGENEYQPGEENPILVEISDPVIHDSDCIQIWHIRDDGEREQINDFSVEEGKISFYATGFSVYEIVQDENVIAVNNLNFGWKKITDVAELANYGEGSDGLYISHTGGFFFKNTIDSSKKRKGIYKTKGSGNTGTDIDTAIEMGVVKYYFEQVDAEDNTQYYVYCFNPQNEKVYIYNNHLLNY